MLSRSGANANQQRGHAPFLTCSILEMVQFYSLFHFLHLQVINKHLQGINKCLQVPSAYEELTGQEGGMPRC